jgi:peroxiredoxin
MKSIVLTLSALLTFALTGIAAPKAADFTLPGSDGKTHTLSEAKGKYVVLEWTNNECPFVKKFYQSGEMQKLQKKYAQQGVVWYSIVSSAPGKQGFVGPKEAEEVRIREGAQPAAVLLDADGKVGRQYQAKTTPQIVIVNPQGEIVYEGAIDSVPSYDSADIPKATNYVAQVLDAVLAGKPAPVTSTKPYGCSVKY